MVSGYTTDPNDFFSFPKVFMFNAAFVWFFVYIVRLAFFDVGDCEQFQI